MSLYNLLLYGSLATIAISGFFVISGVILIRLGYRGYHKGAMLSASVLALIFVVLYMTRSSLFPPVHYTGGHRALYLATLWSHTVLSIVNFPMAIATISFALKEKFDRHKWIAPYTAGVWIYVAITGWLIHLFLR